MTVDADAPSTNGNLRQDENPQEKTSRVKPILMVLGAFAFTAALICGGALAFVFANLENETENPAAVIGLTESIVEVDIPHEWEPCCLVSMDLYIAESARTHFKHVHGEGALVFSQMDVSFGDQQNAEEQLRRRSTNEGAGERFTTTALQSREFEIRGQVQRFDFLEAIDDETGTPYRAVSGYFRSRQGGAVAVFLRVEETLYDEESVVAMIESIR